MAPWRQYAWRTGVDTPGALAPRRHGAFTPKRRGVKAHLRHTEKVGRKLLRFNRFIHPGNEETNKAHHRKKTTAIKKTKG